MTPRDRTAYGRARILVIANETLVGERFHEFVAAHAVGRPVDVVARARERFGLPVAHVVVESGVRDDEAVVAVVA